MIKKETLKAAYSKYKIIIFPSLVGLSSVFLIAFVAVPQISKLISNNEAHSNLVNKVTALENKASALESVDEDILKERVSLALSSLPEQQDLAQIVGLIQQLVASSGYTITSLQIGNPVAGQSGSPQFTLRMEVIGTKGGISQLLSTIEGSYRVMKTSSMDISSVGSSETVNITMVVTAYYQPAPKKLGELEAPLPKLSDKEEDVLSRLTSITSSSQAPSTQEYIPIARGKANPFE